MAFIVAKRPVAAFPIKTTVFDESGQSVHLEFVAQYHRHTPEQLADLQDGLANRARKANGMAPIVRGDGSPVPEFPYSTDIAFIQDKVADRKSVVSGKIVSVRVDLGGLRIIQKNKKTTKYISD